MISPNAVNFKFRKIYGNSMTVLWNLVFIILEMEIDAGGYNVVRVDKGVR